MAGVFDGEGNIHIHLHTNKSGKVSHSIRIGIGSTDILWLRNLREEWGSVGSIGVMKRSRPSHHKPAENWSVSGKEAQHILREILPYLRIKKERAELALAFEVVGRGGRKPADETKRSAIHAQMRLLNRRGADIPAVH